MTAQSNEYRCEAYAILYSFHRFAVRVPPPLGAGRNHSFFFHITRNVVLLEI